MAMQKQCPKCQAAARIDATFCGQCGHTFRTQFQAPNQTQVMVAAPAAGAVALADREKVQLQEYGNQFHNLQSNRRWGCFLCLTGVGLPIAIGLWIWHEVTHAALRQKVAALGVDPSSWEASLRRPVPGWVWMALAVYAMIAVGFVVYALFVGRGIQPMGI
jgi:hypothetical protein